MRKQESLIARFSMFRYLRNHPSKRDAEGTAKKKLLNPNSSFAAVEAYKMARTNLMFMRSGDGCQRIAVTSTFESEGKTVNCTNLAITLAQNGLRVLQIDGDMRRPTMNDMFHIRTEGLSEYLAGISKSKNLLGEHGLIHPTEYKNLYALPAGQSPPNPVELLAGERMKKMLEELDEHFDYILIDTPPVAIVTDALVIKELVRGYIYVVRAERTPLAAVVDNVRHMQQLNGHIIGFILNDVNAKGSYQKNDYRYSRYGKSHGYSRYDRSNSKQAPSGTGTEGA